MTGSQGFPKDARLLDAKQYSGVFNHVDLRISSRHFLLLTSARQQDTARLGIIVAKKHVKLAVQRNRIKRLLRESFRHKKGVLPSWDFVCLAKQNVSRLDNDECHSEINSLWTKFKKKYEQKHGA